VKDSRGRDKEQSVKGGIELEEMGEGGGICIEEEEHVYRRNEKKNSTLIKF